MLKSPGWNQKFNIEICIPQWSGLYLDAYLYVVDGNTCEKIAVVELGKEKEMDYFGELSLEVGTDQELWQNLTAGQIDKAYIAQVINSKYFINSIDTTFHFRTKPRKECDNEFFYGYSFQSNSKLIIGVDGYLSLYRENFHSNMTIRKGGIIRNLMKNLIHKIIKDILIIKIPLTNYTE